MKYYRIMSEKRHTDPYGCGSRAGRWNSNGTKMIYAASSPSLAQLEYLCIQGNVVGLNPWYMITYEIKDYITIAELQADRLPDDWDLVPHSLSTQNFGDEWVNEKSDPFLKVPSSRIDINFYPAEHNLLVNPDFPDISSQFKVLKAIPFKFRLNS